MRYGEELLEIAQAHGEAVGIGAGLAFLSRATGALPGRHEEAATLARRAVDVLEPLGLDEWTGWAWSRLGIEYHQLGHLEDARDCHLRGIAVRRRKECEGCIAYSLVGLGAVLADLRKPDEAVAAFRESLELAIRHENFSLLLAALLGLVDVAWRYPGENDGESALLLFGAARALQSRHGLAETESGRQTLADWQANARGVLGNLRAEAVIDEGSALTLDEVLEIARAVRVVELLPRSQAARSEHSLLNAMQSAE
jgi:tetratricopeptide (TPR) repeat protein